MLLEKPCELLFEIPGLFCLSVKFSVLYNFSPPLRHLLKMRAKVCILGDKLQLCVFNTKKIMIEEKD